MILEEKREKIKEILEKAKVLAVLIPIIGIIIANLQLWKIVSFTNQVKASFIIFDIILNLVIIGLCIIIYKQKKNIDRMKEDVGYLNQRAESLSKLNDSVRCFKHDFYNIIQAIDGYITMNNMPALEKYFSKLLDECEHDKNVELLTAKSVNDPAIYGVLLNKYNKAKEKNIKMNIDVFADFSNVSDKSYLVSRVIGILLDNAIEAASECKKKCINVSFSQDVNDTMKRIIIENTYQNKDVDTKIIFEKEYSSKKEKGNSGLGLWKVRELLRKESKLLLDTTKDSKMFKQKLEIIVQ